jgi:hypothetical protein
VQSGSPLTTGLSQNLLVHGYQGINEAMAQLMNDIFRKANINGGFANAALTRAD